MRPVAKIVNWKLFCRLRKFFRSERECEKGCVSLDRLSFVARADCWHRVADGAERPAMPPRARTFSTNVPCATTWTPTKRKIGPSLKGLFKRDKLKNGKPVNDANVKAMINTGGNGMPAYADLLSEKERSRRHRLSEDAVIRAGAPAVMLQ